MSILFFQLYRPKKPSPFLTLLFHQHKRKPWCLYLQKTFRVRLCLRASRAGPWTSHHPLSGIQQTPPSGSSAPSNLFSTQQPGRSCSNRVRSCRSSTQNSQRKSQSLHSGQQGPVQTGPCLISPWPHLAVGFLAHPALAFSTSGPWLNSLTWTRYSFKTM